MLTFYFFEKGHHFQTVYPHAHHVMPRMRRKKKTSISSNDGDGSDGETEGKRKSSGHGKRRSSKKEIELQPTIAEEAKVQVHFLSLSLKIIVLR